MNREQIIAQAIVSWLGENMKSQRDIAKDGLPLLDVDHFFYAISRLPGFSPDEFSIVLAGFEIDVISLRAYANKYGLEALKDLSDDFNVAARWRNTRTSHRRIIALAQGRQPGVHTLKHFGVPHSRELARAVLRWAQRTEDFAQTGAQKRLLEVLALSPELESLCSLESVSSFLANWSLLLREGPNDAPRKSLPHLGLFADPALFHDINQLELRLVKNLDLSKSVLEMAPTAIRQRRRQIENLKNNPERRDALLQTLTAIEALRLTPNAELRCRLILEEVQDVFKALEPSKVPPQELEENEESEGKEEAASEDLADYSLDALLTNSQESLELIADELERALQLTEEKNSESVEVEITTPEGQVVKSEYKLDDGFLDWLHTFCTKDTWGGLIRSKEPSLELALKNHEHALQEPRRFSPEAFCPGPDGQQVSLSRILGLFDQELMHAFGLSLDLSLNWSRFCELRSELIDKLDYLVHFPFDWLPGRPKSCAIIEEYLDLGSKLYRSIQENYRMMTELSQGLARVVLEGLLSLDVLQVTIEDEEGNLAHKAILLPTHPLHLWRYQRIVALLRGFGSQIGVSDREAILREIRRPEHFLSVLWLGGIPGGLGAGQLLPISSEIHGLETFENFRNAVSGKDGVEELGDLVDRFSVLARHHARPLRVAVINPPEPGRLLSRLAKVLDSHRQSTLPAIRVELFCTRIHAQRIRAALRLSEEREILEEKISSGRLELKMYERPQSLQDLADEFRGRPFHIVAIFDEAAVSIRRRDGGQLLPMSPFCLRKRVRPDLLLHEVGLDPTNDEPPFSEYMQLINEADCGQRDSAPIAWADADELRAIVDCFLQGEKPGAQWVFLADRSLPSIGKMDSVQLLQRRVGFRHVMLVARDYRRFADSLKPVFDRCNLSLSPSQLQDLLREEVGLIESGFLDLFRKKDGRPDSNRVRGLAGMLLAARDYHQRHPSALLIAVDSDLTRLWLRLGRRSAERSDFIALREEDGAFVLECIEVKSTEDSTQPDGDAIIEHAQSQINSTLEACCKALPDQIIGEDPLSAPRCEMLKEVFVKAVQSRAVPPDTRRLWMHWLLDLFQQNPNSERVQFRGEIVRVLLGANTPVREKVLNDKPFRIVLRDLTEPRLQDLISGPVPGVTGSPKISIISSQVNEASAKHEPQPEVAGIALDANGRKGSAVTLQPVVVSSTERLFTVSDLDSLESLEPTREETWPPPVNQLGMIGQHEAVSQLISQVNFCRAAGKRFPDKLLVGPAGVGKSSLARAIARQVISQEEILFNGADLRQPNMIVARLREKGKIQPASNGVARVTSCLLFVDEVHAISNSVSTALLSAMDDQRTTTIDGVVYDFDDVVLILATTDAGKLSEAFNSRPDKTYLRSYTLNELAGIVWLHGKSNMDGREPAKEVCREIAARVRCQPRRAVRTLTQMLIPYLYGVTHSPDEPIDYSRIVEAMNPETVGRWFEAQGIDFNGLGSLDRDYLQYLRRNGATSGNRLTQALGISNKSDFIEVEEYLIRLGLVGVSSAGHSITAEGARYLKGPFDLRDRISRYTGR